jgi:hypothetical protein
VIHHWKRVSRIRLSVLAMACLATAIAACSEVLPPSGPHPIIAADQVKIYENQPAKYELLGAIEVPVTAEMKWDERGDSAPGFRALQAKAAALGANGVLLLADAQKYDTKVGAGLNGRYYLVPLRREPRTACATAIFVINE